MLRGLLKAGTWVFIGIMLGRIAGFIRESFIAANFGVTAQADIAVLILTLPDVFLSLLIGGALGAALIPEFKKYDNKKAWQLFVQIGVIISIFFTILSLILTFNSHHLVNVFGPGLGEVEKKAASTLFGIVMWSIPITALTALLTAYLQSNGKFAIPAMGTLVFNIGIIISLLLPINNNPLLIMAYGIVLASLLRLFTQLYNVSSLFEKTTPFKQNHVSKELLTKYIQALLAAGFIMFLPIIGRILASFDDEGSMATFNYFYKLIELPMAAFLTIFSVVLFPKIAELFSKKDSEQQAIILGKEGFNLVFIFSISITISYAWFSKDYAQLMFGWGVMSNDSIYKIGYLTSIGLLALPAKALSSITVMIFNAKRDMKTPFYISLVAIFVYIPLSIYLANYHKLLGLVIALVVIYWLVFIIQLIILKKIHKINFLTFFVSRETIKLLIISLLLFAPIMITSLHVESLVLRVLLSLFGMLFSMIIGVISIEKYRVYIFTYLAKRKRNVNA